MQQINRSDESSIIESVLEEETKTAAFTKKLEKTVYGDAGSFEKETYKLLEDTINKNLYKSKNQAETDADESYIAAKFKVTITIQKI